MGCHALFQITRLVSHYSQKEIEHGELMDFSSFILGNPATHMSTHTQTKNSSIYFLILSEKAMAPHSSVLAWRIPGTGCLVGCSTWGHQESDTTEQLDFTFTFMHWRRKWQPTPVFLPGESQGRGAWWAAIYGVTQSRTQLKRLSSSSRAAYPKVKREIHI